LLSLVGSLEAELGVGATLDGLGDVGLADLVNALGDGGDGKSGGQGLDGVADIDVLAVTRLGLAVLAGEENKLLLVGLEAGDVGGQRLLAQVGAAEVDGNTDGGSELLGDTSGLVKFPSATNSIVDTNTFPATRKTHSLLRSLRSLSLTLSVSR
jgi:hypothetical protein